MKRRFTILTAAFALLAFLAIPMGMMGQTASFAPADFSGQGTSGTGSEISATVDGVTFACDKGFGTTQIRCYSGGIITISSSNTITAISFTFSGSYNGGMETSYTSLSTTSWTKTLSSQARITACSVSYTGGDTPQPTTYTVTFDAGDGTFVGNTDFPNASNTVAAGTYTLPSATPTEGYVFNGWALGENTYEGGANYTVSGDVNFTASYTENTTPSGDEQWVLTNLADLTASDVFVIVGSNGSNYAMTNNNGTSSAPTAPAVTIENNMIASTVAENIQWTISGNATDGYTFYPNGSTSTWLYCTNSNNGVRVGTNTNNAFVVDGGYLKNSATSRYIGIYNSQDWRCYTSAGGNIANQTFAFYKKVTGGVLPPSISANNVEIAFDAIAGSFEFTVNNPVEGGVTTVTEDVDWISDAVVSGNTVNFSTSANEASTARTATITLTYTYGDNETVTKDVTITQAAAPVIYTTIPTLFEAATSTETSVLVTFNNWVVSGVSTNGKNVFVTDNNNNGFVIYSNEDMSGTYATGNILSGTAVSCSLKKYNGFAELLNVNATDLTIATGGNVTEANVAMADLAGVNTGALVHYENLTCSVNNIKYYLTDGTTTIQVYNSLFAFDALEDGETYNITGIYQQYNNTKEILPRSAADIEEVEVPHSEYTLTVEPFENLELITFVNDEMVMEGDGEIQVNEGDQIMLSIVAIEGYAMESLMVNGVNHVNDIADDFTYTFVMPAEDVTISATAAEVVPPTPGDKYVKVTSNADLTSGQYLIVYEEGAVAFDGGLNNLDVASNTIEVILNDDEIDITSETAAAEFTIDITAGTIKSASGYYIGQTSDANGLASSTTTAYTNTISFDESGNANIVSSGGAYLRYNSASNQNRFRYYKSSSYTAQKAIQLYKNVGEEPATETYTLEIAGYGDSDGGYYLIASPAAINPATVEDPETHENMILTGDDAVNYDLYAFDQTEEDEWRNYKQEAFNLQPGKGYLYAHKRGGNFAIVGVPYSGNGEVTLSKTAGVEWEGWNLVGNPFNEIAYIADGRSFYTMNLTGSEIIATTNNSIEAMEGMFVIANYDGETMTFTTEVPNNDKSTLALNLSNGRNIIDRAIVSFNEGRQLPKFQLNPNHTKVYISQDNKDYAVVNAEEMGEMPVSFKAEKNGSYTLSINAEGVSFTYLHLIDNMTGADVDLLATPSYSFEARTNDYASRFRLVFNANSSVNEQNSEAFAFFNGNNLVINNEGEATLQVIDMMGRMISSEQINGSYNNSLNLSAGVYVLRLSNGNTVKTQKIVID